MALADGPAGRIAAAAADPVAAVVVRAAGEDGIETEDPVAKDRVTDKLHRLNTF